MNEISMFKIHKNLIENKNQGKENQCFSVDVQ